MTTNSLKALALILCAIFTIGCGAGNEGNTANDGAASNDETVEAATATKKQAPSNLSEEEQGALLYANSTTALMGVIVVSMSDAFGSMAQGLGEAFSSMTDDEESVEATDKKIAELQGEAIDKMSEMQDAMIEAMGRIKEEKPGAYTKMFDNASMREGLTLSENAELPTGFVPFNNALSHKEMKRWVVFLSQGETNKEHPAFKYFEQTMEWYQRVNKEYEADPEINAAMEVLKSAG